MINFFEVNETNKMIEKENLEIREVFPTKLAEQTASIEVFNVAPVETP